VLKGIEPMKLKLSMVVLLAVTLGTLLLSGCNNENSTNNGGAMSTNSMAPAGTNAVH
jgi:outer membrane murein-binding lipoprotein Lpp